MLCAQLQLFKSINHKTYAHVPVTRELHNVEATPLMMCIYTLNILYENFNDEKCELGYNT